MINPSIVQIPFEIWGAIFCIMCGMIVFVTRKAEERRSRCLMSALYVEAIQLLSDAAAIYFRGNTSNFGYYAVRISNYMVFLTNFFLGMLLILYISYSIKDITEKQMKTWVGSVFGVCSFGITLLTISQFTGYFYYFDSNNIYHRAKYFLFYMLITLVMISIATIMLIKFRKQISNIDFIVLLTYIVLPVVVIIIQSFIYGLALTNIANTITLLLIFIVHEYDKSEKIIEKEKVVANQRAQLSDTKVSLMMSKIQPHFISNTLLTIQGLYHEDTNKADKVMNSFIGYLQQSYAEIAHNNPISFQKDLEHALNYTDIVMARWPDMIIDYDINCVDFDIPYMTMQPIIENAVRHGIMPLEDGGEILVSTYEDNEFYYVKVKDNGVGFDINNPKPRYDENRAHIGMSNVKERVKIMCNGTVEVNSRINEGTEVIVKIPKEREVIL